jgi:DNA-binding NtrC family response regulator
MPGRVRLLRAPLAERQELVADVDERHAPAAAAQFEVEQAPVQRERRVEVAPHVMDALQAYDWPGNVRELQNVVEGELSLLPPGADVLARIPPVLQSPARPRAAVGAPREVLPLEEVERRACEEALAYYDGNVARAAKALGVAKGTLYSKMKRWGIAAPDGAGPGPRV